MHWLMIETGSNQPYIFGTSKQRLQVAASAAIWQLGYEWVTEAIDAAARELAAKSPVWIGTAGMQAPDHSGSHTAPGNVSRGSLDEWAEKDGLTGGDAPIIILHVVQASGKAELLVPDMETGRRIIRDITLRALESGSDIDVWGAISEETLAPSSSLADIARIRKATSAALQERRYLRTNPVVRHPRLPFHQPCAYTGMPAVEWKPEVRGGEPVARGARASFLFGQASNARKRMIDEMLLHADMGFSEAGTPTGVETRELKDAIVGLRDLSDGVTGDWVGVLHADGNGIGAVFSRFNDPVFLGEFADDAAGVVGKLGIISHQLEDITWTALRNTITDLVARNRESRGLRNAVLPILVGGDDIVAVVTGDIGLDFAETLSLSFKRAAEDKGADINELIGVAANLAEREAEEKSSTAPIVKSLSLAVGLVFTKPKHPFHHSIALAESLTSAAKEKTRRTGACAIHVVYESALRELSDLRADQAVEGCCYLSEPLIVDPDDVADAVDDGQVETIKGFRDLMREFAGGSRGGVSRSVQARIRDAIALATSKRDAATRFAAVKAQDESIRGPWAGKSPLLDSVAIDDASGSTGRFFAEGSPTSLVTALAVVDVLGGNEPAGSSDRTIQADEHGEGTQE